VLPPALTIWIEGAAIFTGGSDMTALNPVGTDAFSGKRDVPAGPNFVGQKPNVGWEIAVGADYRLPSDPSWHLSFDFRYGQSKAKKKSFSNHFDTCCYPFVSTTNQSLFTEHEDHIVADFMIGRDFGFGRLLGLNQVKFGIRVADLRARQNVQAQHAFQSGNSSSTNFVSAAALNINARSEFLGIGPRIAAEGFMPLGGPWGIDWAGGLAVLFGKQKFDASFNGVFASHESSAGNAFTFAGNLCTGNVTAGGFSGNVGPILLGCTSNKAVFNADVSAALSYAFTPRGKISAGLRFDGYWGALRTLNADFSGGFHNEDRFYWGPFVRLTGQF
jgi:hypothetical protein